ncbi:hypothetical protein GCM10020358_75220 [Amorphoplanes nipponensis]|uniref:Uncharacterized protein n=1 Tax=Actinoplanes nipponensis TaxID=135950 RepID=A0A919MPH5_9ACTN|nr:hypothetical protein [Actinoplanes nipponensis]GIE52072.1 hypothetical protein Ani05nite_56060 [Actinoplanes nipponensis]
MNSNPATAPARAYTAGQTDAGWRAMSMLARLVQRGGHPAAVTPTIELQPGEKQYGAFLVDVSAYFSTTVDYASSIFASGGLFFTGRSTETRGGWRPGERQAATITSQRLVLGEVTYDFRSLILVQPNPLDWSVSLYFQGAQPIMLRGPWVPWMTVVMCAELYGSSWPPGHAAELDFPIKDMCENAQ